MTFAKVQFVILVTVTSRATQLGWSGRDSRCCGASFMQGVLNHQHPVSTDLFSKQNWNLAELACSLFSSPMYW